LWVATALGLGCGAWPVAGHAQEPRFGPEWIALESSRLEALRGGFVMPSGLVLSFGIERAVFVNGELVASTRVDVADVAGMTAEQAQDLADLQGTLLVQVGAGNTLRHSGHGGVVIQNTLDGQAIRVATALNASVGTLGMFQDLNASAALQAALITAPGTP
jgi:hypothetical protein